MRLTYSIITILFLIVSSCGKVNGRSYNPVSEHPRLLLHKGGEADVKTAINRIPEVKNIHDSIIRMCDRVVKWPLLERKLTGVRLLDVSREALRRIFYLSYGYRMTGDKRYADRAIKEMLNVCSFSDWHPSHFLDVAEMTMAVAIGYDWLYDVISPTDRKKIEKAVMEKAFKPNEIGKYNYFYRNRNNWNSVCNAGMVFGAAALADVFPEMRDELVGKCIEENPKALEAFAPDGGYPEGYGYWSYGTTSEVMLIDALQTAFGSDFGLSSADGFLNTVEFMTYMATPSGMCFNFSDSPSGAHDNPANWWFAAHSADSSLLYEELKYLKKGNMKLGELRLLPLVPIFASRLKSMEIKRPSSNFWFSRGETPVFIYRGGWDKPTDTYLGVKGGSPSTSHAHMDARSFVYEFDGVRWAADLGMPDYNFVEQKGVKLWDFSQDGQRWDIMRMRNDCHNTLTVDDSRHMVKSNALIVDTFSNMNRKGALVDLTATLGKVKSARREVSLDANDWLTVTDSINTGENGVRLLWTMVTPAHASVSGKEIVLEKDGKRMSLSFDAPYDVKPYIRPNTPMHDYDQPNGDFVRVGFTVDIPANMKTVFKSSLKPQATEN